MKHLNRTKKIVWVALLAVLLVFQSASALTLGPNSGGTFGDDATVGTIAWGSPSNATSSDDARATASLTDVDTTSHYLTATNFGFTVPASATIDGVVVEVEKSKSSLSDCLFVRDSSVKLIKGGVISGNDKASASNWTNTDTYASYGGAADLWGLTLADTDIESSTFGVAFSAYTSGSGETGCSSQARVDHIRITVYYSEGNTAPTGTWNSAAQKTDGTGVVDLSVEIDDTEDNNAKAKVEYETTGSECDGPWTKATLQTPITVDCGSTPDITNSNAYQVGTATAIGTTCSNTVQFDWASATDLPSGNGTYCLRLTANDGTTDQSSPATRTLTIDNVAPTFNGSLTNGGKGRTSVILTFGAQATDTNFSQYKIFYKQGSSGVTVNDTQHTDADLTSISYNGTTTTTVTGLTANTQYVFNIWAYDTYGNKTAAGTELTVTTLNKFVETGYYIGTGADDRAVTGVGFSPDLVMIRDSGGNGTDGLLWKTTSMSGETTADIADAEAVSTSNQIQSIDADGFTVGSDIDANAQNIFYKWIAFENSDCTSTGIFCVGTYTGDGNTTQTISSVGFQPDMVMVKSAGASVGAVAFSALPANYGFFGNTAAQNTTGALFTSMASTGFTVGNNASVNTAATTYYYVAWRAIEGEAAFGSYAGNTTDNRSITVGFEPDLVFVRSSGATAHNYNQRELHGDQTATFSDQGDFADRIQDFESNGFQVGASPAVNTTGNTYYWGAFKGITAPTVSGTFSMDTGTYTGNGTTQSITGLGFEPDLVIIKASDLTWPFVYRTSIMYGDASVLGAGYAGALYAGAISSMDADGFTVGADAAVNGSGSTYHWQAFGNAFSPYTMSGAADFAIGAYQGNSIDNRDIQRVPFQPDFVFVSSAAWEWIRGSNMSGDVSLSFHNVAELADHIQALNSDGFQVGADAEVNGNGSTYWWFAFKSGDRFATGSYTGSGSTQNITSLAFQPELVWIKNAGSAGLGIMRSDTLVGDSTQFFYEYTNATVRITSLLNNGFSLGDGTTNGDANSSTSTYRWWSWNNGNLYKASGSLVSSSIDTDSYPTITNKNALRLIWSQDLPSGCTLTVKLRGTNTGPTPDYATSTWSDLYSGSGSTVTKNLVGVAALQNKRFYQYQVDMTSCNNNNQTPTLYDLYIDLD